MDFSAAGPSDTDFSAAGPSESGPALSPFQFAYLQAIKGAKRKQRPETSNDAPRRKKSRKDLAGIESYGDLYSKYRAYVSQSRIPGPREKQNQPCSKVFKATTNMFAVSLIEKNITLSVVYI